MSDLIDIEYQLRTIRYAVEDSNNEGFLFAIVILLFVMVMVNIIRLVESSNVFNQLEDIKKLLKPKPKSRSKK